MSVAELLRQKGLPFIFATGYGEAGVSIQCASAPLLTKPFTPQDLAKALGTAIGRD